jgi:RNA-directed DNA polymerase
MVQTALKHVIEPIFERDFAEHSYGFRPGRGCKDALRRVDELLKAGYVYVVDADLKSYFDTIPHDRLMERIREKISDGKVLTLIERYLQQDVMHGLEQWTPEEGSPQGAVISPLLSNIYLDPLDHLVAATGFEMVRYADDFVILCRSPEAAEAALAVVREWTAANGLTLHPEKTRVVNAETEGFDFLGYHFKHGDRFPRSKSLHKLQDTLRAKTKRCNGNSLERIIRSVNATLRGWFEYFKHVTKRFVFEDLDRFIRQRLRAILKKRKSKKSRPGYPKGKDFQRWPNRFFADRGLFSLSAAHAKACQPSSR